jgi:hypothetical protein
MAERRARNPLDALTQELVALATDVQRWVGSEAVPSAGAKRIREKLLQVSQQLSRSIEALDPIRQPAAFFDPTSPSVLGRMVGIALIAGARRPLSRLEAFYGSGVYALYYVGPFEAYASLSRSEHPIYVGKAGPKDPQAKSPQAQGDRLFNRLKDHARSIRYARTTLDIEHFEYRALVVQSGWETAAENYLINLFRPVWNNEVSLVLGIGKHGDSTETRANRRSPWDTLHPGRPWAHSGRDVEDAKQPDVILAELQLHYGAVPPFRHVDEILRRFLDEMGVL